MRNKKLLLGLSVATLIGFGGMAYATNLLKWPFYAPAVGNDSDVVGPQDGDIIYEGSSTSFKGYANGSWVILGAPATATTPGKKIGYDHTTGTNVTFGVNDMHAVRVYAPTDATITRLGILLGLNASGKKMVLGIYSDSSNLPGTKLAQTAEYTTISNDGNYRTFDLNTAVTLNKDTAYWLVVHSDSGLVVDNAFNSPSVGGQKYRTLSYSSTLPSSFGSPTGDAGAGISMGGF